LNTKEKSKYLLGICIGTSSVKALLTNTSGKVICSSEITYEMSMPKPGWTEQEPDLWVKSSIKAIRDLLNKSNIKKNNLICIGISGQMHSTVFLDGRKNVIRPALLWNDQRTSKECEFLVKSIGYKKIIKLTSNKPINSFSLPKILWLRNNEENNFGKLKKFCLAKDYLKLIFSGDISTDPSDASGTLCFDVENNRWSKELLGELDLDYSILPNIKPSIEFGGFLSKPMSELLGLQAGVPIITGVADTAGEMIGNGIKEDGEAIVKLGTGGDLLVYSSKFIKNDGVFDLFSFPGGGFYTVQVTLSTAASLNWVLNNIGFDYEEIYKNSDKNMRYLDLKKYIENKKFALLEQEVEKTPLGAGGLIFLPYLIGERSPYFDPKARGALIGINLNTRKRNILRSVLEGIAFAQRDCYEILKEKKFEINKIIISGGGAKSELWCQIYSDVFNSQIYKMSSEEGPSMGVCILGSVATGVYDSIEQASQRFLSVNKIYKPNHDNHNKYNDLYKIYHGLYDKLKIPFSEINNFVTQK
jgi:xylulokinase